MDQQFSANPTPAAAAGTAVLNQPNAPVSSGAPQAPAPDTDSLMAAVSAALNNPPASLQTVSRSSDPAAVSAASGSTPAAPAAQPEQSGPLDLLPESGDPTANKTRIIVKALRGMEESIRNIIRLLEDQGPTSAVAVATAAADTGLRELAQAAYTAAEGRVVEGVFDGRQMVGADGQQYPVPPNYASKSKLVEGDLLKLTITPRGSFIYKQIGPIERSRIMASLGFDQTVNEWYAAEGDKRWSILKASVTFFRGEPGDDVALLVPKNAPSKWAAVENIIKKDPLG